MLGGANGWKPQIYTPHIEEAHASISPNATPNAREHVPEEQLSPHRSERIERPLILLQDYVI